MAKEKLGSLTDCYVTQENGKKALAVTGGGVPLDVIAQDPTNISGDIHLLNSLNSIYIDSPTIIGSYTLTLQAGHNFVVGNYITLSEGSVYYQSRVVAVDTNEITIAVPMFYEFTVSAVGYRKTAEIQTADGSSVPEIFEAGPPPGQKWDIYSFSFVARDETDMDDAKFVGAPALTKGCLISTGNELLYTRAAFRQNSDFRLLGILNYSDKAPSGEYGLSFYKDFRSRNGVAIRLDGDLGETVKLVIQDSMLVLTYARALIAGHIVEE